VPDLLEVIGELVPGDLLVQSEDSDLHLPVSSLGVMPVVSTLIVLDKRL